MATQLFTSTSIAALGYAVEHKVGVLCDGSLAVCDFDGSTGHLYQVTSPGSSPTTTSIQTFSITSGTNTVTSLYVVNTGSTSSDVWVAYADNSATGEYHVAHGTYTASGSSWSWNNTGFAVNTVNSFGVPSIVWTGTYLILAARIDTFEVALWYTATKAGNAGWSALINFSSTSGSSHYYPTLLHDAANGCTIAVYSLQADTVVARALPDSSSPALANWSSEVSLSGTVNVGAANVTATLDTTNKNLHVAWIDSGNSNNPQYIKSTYTTTSVTAGTAFSISGTGHGGTTTTTPALALDSNSNIYLLWAGAAGGAASDISYTKIVSPYASGNVGAITNLTNASANDNVFPQVPKDAAVSLAFLPVVYLKTAASPYAAMLDTSITLSSTVTGAAAIVESAKISANGSATGVGVVGLVSHFTQHVAGFETITTGPVSIQGHGLISAASPAYTGGGPGDITRSSGTQTANKSGNGYGAGDITGTEYDYVYKDSTGKGWAVGSNPWYGGMPLSAWYQLGPSLNTTLPQKTTKTGNQFSLLTTQSGGWMHWENDVSSFQSSELVTFVNSGNFTELAPTNTPFRAYLKAIGDTNDGNGMAWQSTVCIYPGDPGLMVFRFDMTNNSGSTKAADESDFQLIASMVGDNGVNPTGVWNPNNGFYGTIGGSTTTGWPSSGTTVGVVPDYLGITPNSGSGITVGVGAAIIASPVTAMGWPNVDGLQMNENGSSVTVPTRMKIGLQYGPGSLYNIAAGQTRTFYVLRVLRFGLTAPDMAAMAADYKFPGTPTVTTGTFTTFSNDERAYTFAAGANNVVSLTLDMTPANVTVRYKPVLKVTGWTGGAPTLTWGGITLVAGVDYRHYEDTTNGVLYLQLYYDVVPSGSSPLLGQRANATLNVLPTTLTGAVGIVENAKLSANGTAVHFVPAHIALSGSLKRTAAAHIALQSTLTRSSSAHLALLATPTRAVTTGIALSKTSTRPASAHVALQSTLTRTAGAHAALQSFFTRSAPVHTPLYGTVTRAAPAHIAISGLPARQATTTIALRATLARSAVAHLALQASLTRTTGAHAALQSFFTRSASVHAPLVATPTRPVTTRLALSGGLLRAVGVHAALLQTVGRSVSVHVAITQSTFTRPVTAHLALRGALTRTAPATIPLVATPTRAVSAHVALTGGVVRAVTAHLALQSALSRPVTARLALSSAFLRTSVSHVALAATLTRSSVAHAALQSLATRAVAAHLAVQANALQRTAPAHVALTAALTRAVPVHVPLTGPVTRAVSVRMALTGGSARAVGVTLALQSVGLRRSATARLALLGALTRPVSAHIAVQTTPARQVQTHVALQTTLARSVAAHLALFSALVRTTPAHLAVQSLLTRSVVTHAALQATPTHPVSAHLALQSALARSVTQRIALQSALTRSVAAHLAAQSLLRRQATGHTALLATPTRPVVARLALAGGLARAVTVRLALSGSTLRAVSVHISLSPTLTRTVVAWIALTYPVILAPALVAQVPGGGALGVSTQANDTVIVTVI